jgi:hypothetical protein
MSLDKNLLDEFFEGLVPDPKRLERMEEMNAHVLQCEHDWRLVALNDQYMSLIYDQDWQGPPLNEGESDDIFVGNQTLLWESYEEEFLFQKNGQDEGLWIKIPSWPYPKASSLPEHSVFGFHTFQDLIDVDNDWQNEWEGGVPFTEDIYPVRRYWLGSFTYTLIKDHIYHDFHNGGMNPSRYANLPEEVYRELYKFVNHKSHWTSSNRSLMSNMGWTMKKIEDDVGGE